MKLNKYIRKSILSSIAAASLLACSISAQASTAVDANLKNYQTVSGVSGNLNSIGSDTLNNLMTFWAEGFKAKYPNVNIQIEGKGSSTAPPALIEGTSQLGPMSRAMKASEIDAFEKKYGYKPTQIPVAIDALAVYTHKDNPIKGLTLQQIDGIFSSTRKLGGEEIKTWGQLGLTGPWASKPISLYGRNSASGTYAYFKEVAMSKGDYKSTVKEQPGSSSVVQGVASDLGAIGYSGIGYKTSGVNAVAVGKASADLAEPNVENAISNKYPLSRFLYIYVNKKPGQPVDKLTKEFVNFVLSKEGQQIVVKDGYFPLPATLADKSAKNL
ncbi:MAG: PstS family phosphate ABC transporter substrate-binding protein [Deltaproteobacteria bacterium]|nr:PstS family phosphate ABC transporter substrate-binding protein [Deltaproteobacteria bacterium]